MVRLDAALGDAVLYLPDLLRLQRLLGHRCRQRAGAGLRSDAELPPALSGSFDLRFLAALAHFPDDLVSDLRLPPAGRQAGVLPLLAVQYLCRIFVEWLVAWGKLDFRRVGRVARILLPDGIRGDPAEHP